MCSMQCTLSLCLPLHACVQELWPSLIEKAYASLHGGYAAIAQAGCIADALTDLTGGVVETINLSAGLLSEGAVWLHIMRALASEGSLAVCTTQPAAPTAPTAPTAATTSSSGWGGGSSTQGLLPDTPYTILAAKALPSGTQLLRLHNPWAPEGCWQGAWDAGTAAEWSTDEGQAALAADPAMEEGLQDPATFWCPFW